jgi:signal transduction histidine kinase
MMDQSNAAHHIEYELSPGGLIIDGDQQRIEQVIINLISNAIKYSPKADRVIVKSFDMDDKIQVTVQDFGIGIEHAHLDRIFSRFYRVENLAAHMSGLGIGLYISQEIIRRHNGNLWVTSTPGQGSTFYFELPKTITQV